MTTKAHEIVLLPQDVRAQISSAHEITSQQHVIDGLFKNALDAGAHSISIEANFAKGYFLVEDDGAGIREIAFSVSGHLAKLHCTRI